MLFFKTLPFCFWKGYPFGCLSFGFWKWKGYPFGWVIVGLSLPFE